MSATLLRFVAVGGCGFAVDCGLLLLLLQQGLHVLPARFLSFSGAVIVTGLLHRNFTFSYGKSTPIARQASKHAVVQTVGALTNFAVFFSLQASIASLQDRIILTLALSAVIALMVNYSLSRLWTFTPENKPKISPIS